MRAPATAEKFAKGFGAARFNPFPVRLAVDIGTGRTVTATVARVDARAGAIRDVLHHTDVPLQLRWRERQVLDPASWPAITNALRMVYSSATSVARAAEVSAMISLPIAGGESTIAKWRSEMKLRVHARGQAPGMSQRIRSKLDPVFGPTSAFYEVPRVGSDQPAASSTERIAFAAAAAAAKSLNPASMLVLRERANAIQVLGLDRGLSEEDVVPGSSVARAHRDGRRFGDVVAVDIPITSAEAHMRLVRDVQQRPKATAASSPNPTTREEFVALREMLRGEIAKALPEWVAERAALDAPIVAYGGNGSVWNIAARAARSVHMGCDRVDVAGQFEYAGLTDVILAENLPHPRLVVPQLALFSALCRALRTPRVEYLPEVAMTHAMLVDDAFWATGRHGGILEEAAEDERLQQRVHRPPRDRFDPHRVIDGDRKAYRSELSEDERLWNGGN